MLVFWIIVLESLGSNCQNIQRSIEVNTNLVEGEHLEFPISNGMVEKYVTLCFRSLFKHSNKPEIISYSNIFR